jgi:hypothetical protein
MKCLCNFSSELFMNAGVKRWVFALMVGNFILRTEK